MTRFLDDLNDKTIESNHNVHEISETNMAYSIQPNERMGKQLLNPITLKNESIDNNFSSLLSSTSSEDEESDIESDTDIIQNTTSTTEDTLKTGKHLFIPDAIHNTTLVNNNNNNTNDDSESSDGYLDIESEDDDEEEDNNDMNDYTTYNNNIDSKSNNDNNGDNDDEERINDRDKLKDKDKDKDKFNEGNACKKNKYNDLIDRNDEETKLEKLKPKILNERLSPINETSNVYTQDISINNNKRKQKELSNPIYIEEKNDSMDEMEEIMNTKLDNNDDLINSSKKRKIKFQNDSRPAPFIESFRERNQTNNNNIFSNYKSSQSMEKIFLTLLNDTIYEGNNNNQNNKNDILKNPSLKEKEQINENKSKNTINKNDTIQVENKKNQNSFVNSENCVIQTKKINNTNNEDINIPEDNKNYKDKQDIVSIKVNNEVKNDNKLSTLNAKPSLKFTISEQESNHNHIRDSLNYSVLIPPSNCNKKMTIDDIKKEIEKLHMEGRTLKHQADKINIIDNDLHKLLLKGKYYLEASIKFFEHSLYYIDLKHVYRNLKDENNAKKYGEQGLYMIPQTVSLIDCATRYFEKCITMDPNNKKNRKWAAISLKFSSIVWMSSIRLQYIKLYALNNQNNIDGISPLPNISPILHSNNTPSTVQNNRNNIITSNSNINNNINNNNNNNIQKYLLKEMGNMLKSIDHWRRSEIIDKTVLPKINNFITIDIHFVINEIQNELNLI